MDLSASGDLLCSGIYYVRELDPPKFWFPINLWIYSRHLGFIPDLRGFILDVRKFINYVREFITNLRGFIDLQKFILDLYGVYSYIREFIPDLLIQNENNVTISYFKNHITYSKTLYQVRNVSEKNLRKQLLLVSHGFEFIYFGRKNRRKTKQMPQMSCRLY